MAKGIITTVEITETHVKWFQARQQRSGNLLSYASIKKLEKNFTESSVEDVARVLKEITLPKEVEKEGVVVIIPRRVVILKQLSLPALAQDDLAKMIALQITNLMPYAREDVIFDFSVIEQTAGYTKALVAIVHKDIVHKYLAAMEAVGVVVAKCVLSSIGISGWFFTQQQKTKAGVGAGNLAPAAVALIHIDDSHAEICFCADGKLLFSRSINGGIKDLTAGNMPMFIEQIGLTLGAYKNEGLGKEIRKIFILSKSAGASLLQEKLKEYYQVPVEAVTPLDDLSCEKNFSLSSLGASQEVAAAASFGFLLGDVSKTINLLPAAVLDTKRAHLRRRLGMRVAVMAVAAFALGVAALQMGIHQKESYLKDIKNKIKGTKSATAAAEKRIQLLRFVKEETGARLFVVDVIKELYDLTPQEISFRLVALSSQGMLDIQGFAETGAGVNLFQRRLAGSPFFKGVALENATKTRRFGQEEFTNFKITAQLAARERVKR
jgi:Tfp pilus assembly protein PilN